METIMHNGVPCVKAKVHRLPTEEATDNNIFEYQGGYFINKDGYSSNHKNFHLYITTDEEIKDGDWKYCSHTETVLQAHKIGKNYVCHECKKIIATTEPKLTLSEPEMSDKDSWWCGKNPIKRFISWQDAYKYWQENKFPQIPQSFIKEYCKAGGIDEVLVEYTVNDCYVCGDKDDVCKELQIKGNVLSQDCDTFKSKPKLNPDNTIIIHPVEEKMYSREEVIELMKKAIKQGDDWRCELDRIAVGFSKENPDVISKQLLNPIKWIEENL